ncbi:MAG: hypothetical protein IPL77_20900 [Flavobacteriales bacterium]|nr:hypothetical protein [Flavobacteriales bacterium]MBK9538806.1 hypothetical protein [Flavobacteriales bacterium]
MSLIQATIEALSEGPRSIPRIAAYFTDGQATGTGQEDTSGDRTLIYLTLTGFSGETVRRFGDQLHQEFAVDGVKYRITRFTIDI